MFLSFLKSMQTKSQDAQNPGLWVNGNRMPMQEELARKLDPSASSFFKAKSGGNNHLQLVAPPVDADGNREVTPEEAARSAALSAEIDASVKADKVRAQLQDQDKVVTDTRNPLEYAKDSTYDELDQRAAAIKRRRGQGLPVYSPDSAYEQDQNSAKAVVAGLQENTKRSMFLTHLQSMQTKSQDAQNPGLWVNGNRMPVQESLLGAAVRGIGQVAKFGYDLGNNLGNGMMNAANTAVSGSPVKPYPQPNPLRPEPLQPSIRPPGFNPLGRRLPPPIAPTDRGPPSRIDPEIISFNPNTGKVFDPNDHWSRGPVRPGDFIKPRPSPGSRPDWAPDYPYPNPSPRPRFPDYNPGYRPRPSPGDRLPGLINPKPKSPTDITVDNIINPNTGNVSLSTGEANKPGAVTLYPEGQNILNPQRKPDLMRPGTPEDTEMQRRITEPIRRWEQEHPDQKRYGAEKPMDRLRKRVNSGEPLGIIPPTDPNLMNRMY